MNINILQNTNISNGKNYVSRVNYKSKVLVSIFNEHTRWNLDGEVLCF
jgi:hypothetical protein